VAIDQDAWAPIPYRLSTPEVSGADVAETSYTAFSGVDAITVRLVVRRVRPTPGSQLALFTTWDYHAFVTNRLGDVGEIEADHRRHPVVEQRIAELKSAGLAHLPSGKSESARTINCPAALAARASADRVPDQAGRAVPGNGVAPCGAGPRRSPGGRSARTGPRVGR
jgi:hypothetical protein